MVQKKTIRKTRRRQRRRQPKASTVPPTHPWTYKGEDQMVSVGFQRRVDVRTSAINAGVAGTARVHIYWGIKYVSGLADNVDTPSISVSWDTCNLTERTTYVANYAEMRLNWVKFRYMPCNLTIVGGPTTAVTAVTGVASSLVIDTTNVDGPDNTTIIQDQTISPFALAFDHQKEYFGQKDCMSYLKQGSAYSEWLPTSGSFTADEGATSFLIDYINLPVSTPLAVVWVEYSLSFRGRRMLG